MIRLCFPSPQQNVSPATILPAFLQVLGRKLDQGDDTKDYRASRVSSFLDYVRVPLRNLYKYRLLSRGRCLMGGLIYIEG